MHRHANALLLPLNSFFDLPLPARVRSRKVHNFAPNIDAAQLKNWQLWPLSLPFPLPSFPFFPLPSFPLPSFPDFLHQAGKKEHQTVALHRKLQTGNRGISFACLHVTKCPHVLAMRSMRIRIEVQQNNGAHCIRDPINPTNPTFLALSFSFVIFSLPFLASAMRP